MEMQQTELSILISTLGGVLLSLILAYVPGVKDWWEQLDGERKRAALGILYLCIAAGLYVPACFGGPVVVACEASSIWQVIPSFFLALIGSQGMYVFLPERTKARMSAS